MTLESLKAKAEAPGNTHVRLTCEEALRLIATVERLAGALGDIQHPNMNPDGPAYGAIEIAREALAKLKEEWK